MSDSVRVAIFIDQSNFYGGLAHQFGDGRYQLEKLVPRIVGARTTDAVNLYIGTVDPRRQSRVAAAQRRFLHKLTTLPFQVNVFARPLQYFSLWPNVPAQEKGIDTKIVQDLIVGAFDQTYDVAVLLSGDQDFVEVVRLLHRRFPVQLETYYPMARRHLYSKTKDCFSKSEVITKAFYHSIR